MAVVGVTVEFICSPFKYLTNYQARQMHSTFWVVDASTTPTAHCAMRRLAVRQHGGGCESPATLRQRHRRRPPTMSRLRPGHQRGQTLEIFRTNGAGDPPSRRSFHTPKE